MKNLKYKKWTILFESQIVAEYSSFLRVIAWKELTIKELFLSYWQDWDIDVLEVEEELDYDNEVFTTPEEDLVAKIKIKIDLFEKELRNSKQNIFEIHQKNIYQWNPICFIADGKAYRLDEISWVVFHRKYSFYKILLHNKKILNLETIPEIKQNSKLEKLSFICSNFLLTDKLSALKSLKQEEETFYYRWAKNNLPEELNRLCVKTTIIFWLIQVQNLEQTLMSLNSHLREGRINETDYISWRYSLM